jgi:hypothetical protein
MTRPSLAVARQGGYAGSRAAMATMTAGCPSPGCRLGGVAFAAEGGKFPAAVVRLLAAASAELDRHVNDRAGAAPAGHGSRVGVPAWPSRSWAGSRRGGDER